MPWTGRHGNHRRWKQMPKDWAKIRAQVIRRDHGTCVICGRPGNHVDHIQRGNNHSLNNLRLLCQHCHMARTGRDGGTARRQPRRRARPPEPHPGFIRPDPNMHTDA